MQKHAIHPIKQNIVPAKISDREILVTALFALFIDLIHMTNDPKVSMPVLADLLADRLRVNNWVVAFKALITSHNLMTLGNEVTHFQSHVTVSCSQCVLCDCPSCDPEMNTDNAVSGKFKNFNNAGRLIVC